MAEVADERFELTGKDARALGHMTDTGFLVYAGAIARNGIVPSATDTVTPVRKKLIAEGVLVEEAGQLRLTRDYQFDSPSGAAAAILGRTANGWIEWKSPDGRSLSEVKRVVRRTSQAMLSDECRELVLQTHQKLLAEGTLPPQQALDKQYANFRERFGPQVLGNFDGEPLLRLMHEQGSRDSLGYWLEFKNDEEFESRQFGSISGGSALKFRVFQRRETGLWQAMGSSNQPREITLDEAIEIARSNRDQLLSGVKLLEALPATASDEDYAQLQDQMDELAPDVSRLAFGHKYFSMMCPDKLDDYHSPAWQRYILLKLLQRPPDREGRYICAGRLVAASREVGLPTATFDAVLNSLFGGRHHYWQIACHRLSSESVDCAAMSQNDVAFAWPGLSDLSWVEKTRSSRERLRQSLEVSPTGGPQHNVTRFVSGITRFVAEIGEGDVVLAVENGQVYAIGKVTGPYYFEEGSPQPHRRPVEWMKQVKMSLPEPLAVTQIVQPIRDEPDVVLEIEREIQNLRGIIDPPPRLLGIAERIRSNLERKGQVILYGPPGTGKTYWAMRTANDLAAISAFGKLFDSLSQGDKAVVTGNATAAGLVRLCCFHPAYGYEDFIEGYRPESANGQMSFAMRDGIFKRICNDAQTNPERKYILVVDEINRGDVPRIFGELLTSLELDKRSMTVHLPMSQERFSIPKNVQLIGTMNTADRSISLLDAALRRRFGFIEVMPESSVLGSATVQGIALRAWLDALNQRIRESIGRDARNLQIGHSYLMSHGIAVKDMAAFKRVLRDDILPLLEEYCYEQFDTLAAVLGDLIVDKSAQRIRHELFADGQEADLVQALLAPCPDIALTVGNHQPSELSVDESLPTDDGVELS